MSVLQVICLSDIRGLRACYISRRIIVRPCADVPDVSVVISHIMCHFTSWARRCHDHVVEHFAVRTEYTYAHMMQACI